MFGRARTASSSSSRSDASSRRCYYSAASRTGSLDFDSTTLEEAIAEVNRYTAKSLVIENPRLRELRLSGRCRVGDVDAFAFTLRERLQVSAAEEAERIVLR